jgi:CBS domain containing-hemolysin-like protein
MRRMAESGHNRLPVAVDGELIGMLSASDILEYVEVRAGLTRAGELPLAQELPDDTDQPAPRPRTPSGPVGVWVPHGR